MTPSSSPIPGLFVLPFYHMITPQILIFSGSRRAEHIEENLAYYRKIFPEITDHFRQDNLAVTKMVGLKV